MYVNVTKNTYKGKIYYSVRIFHTYYKQGKKINKIVKTIGTTTDLRELEKLKRTAWAHILKLQKDIPLSYSQIKKIRVKSPIGLIRTIEKILTNLDILDRVKEIFINNYDEFLEEIAYRFYSVTSERMLCNLTVKPKDRYYRLLDDVFERKEELEDMFYNALVSKGKIIQHEIKIDTTSTYFEGDGISLAMFGYSRDHRGDKKQIVVLLILIDNYPLFSYVYEGNRKDVTLFLQIVKDLKKRVRCEKIILFCDRGFFDEKYPEMLEKEGIFYVMAVPRRKGIWSEFHDKKSNEFWISGRRAILYENTEYRKELLSELDDTLKRIEEDFGKLTPSEIKRKYKYALKFIDAKNKKLKQNAILKEKKVLGRWLVLTNLQDKSREEIIESYKSLQQIERDFRTLKNYLNIRPIGHWKDEHAVAHIYICVLTLLIKHILEKEFGRDKVEELLDIFSYEIITDKGILHWSEKF